MGNTPNVRFKGFTEDWEQRKLIEVCDYVDYRGKTPTKTEDGIFLVTAKNVKDGFIDYETSKEYISENAYEKVMRRGKPEIGDVLITTEAPCGNVAQVNKANIALAQRIIKYRGHIGVVDNTYLKHYLLSPEFQKILNAKSSGGTVQGIKGSILHQQKIIYPSYEEQKKIGQHMDSLDHLITLHQQKCAETKEFKKYMLQNMFPQKDEKVPKIRFDGFTGDWKQRKVTDLSEIYIGLVTTMTEHYTDSGHLLIRNSDIKDGYFEFGENPIYLDEEFSEQNKSRMHQLGDVITVHTGDIGTSAVIGENEVNSIGFATIVTRPNQEKLDSNYFATYLNTDTHKQWAISMATGDGRSNYNLKDYTKLVVPIPEIEEQKKIAACIGNLNNLITLHQQKCNALKEFKKYMLQNMFPQKGENKCQN